MKIKGKVIKYGDNIDTDVIIPTRHLNTSDPKSTPLYGRFGQNFCEKELKKAI